MNPSGDHEGGRIGRISKFASDSTALVVDEVLPAKPIRQWVLTVPFPLRFLFAVYPELMAKVLIMA